MKTIFTAATLCVALCATAPNVFCAEKPRQVERLDRGLVAVKRDTGVFLSWRLLGYEDPQTLFDVYRNEEKINEKPLTGATCLPDVSGTLADRYVVKALANGKELSASQPVTPWDKPYMTLQLNRPPLDTAVVGAMQRQERGFGRERFSGYAPNDCSVGDLDGDGVYELVVKWNARARDNSQSGVTDPVLLDAYTLDGAHLWRIDLGVNIRAGAHYTQFMVYDLDGDGKAELVCKTAPGTKDGQGKSVILGSDDPNADYR
ncbi:MAG: rhamnogalacturonan lyase, partial [Prevotellaceae bacterium]|nr:rhamnogalacturonan lyase [Prevotellaceae bacterium]